MKAANHIIYEDNHLLIVNKPAGLLVQGDKTGDESLLDFYKAYIKKKYNKPGNVYLGLAHRIDRPVSGAVVMAKTSKALERLTRLFHDQKVDKTYWAMVRDNPPREEGTLSNWLMKDQKKNITRIHESAKKGAKLSTLDYKLQGRIGDFYLLEVKPNTGRPHQIRVQLANIGCPIVGDVKYGSSQKSKDGSIQLHARRLEFEHPVKKEPLKVTAPIPGSQLWSIFKGFKP